MVLKDPNDPLGHLKNVNAAYSTPSLLASFSPDDLPNLDTINLAGEPVPQSIADAWSHKRLCNGYGPSEVSIYQLISKFKNRQKANVHASKRSAVQFRQ